MASDTYWTRGSAVDYRAVYVWGTSSQPVLFGALLAVDFWDPFCFCGLVDVSAQEVSKKHSLDHSDRRRTVSIDPCANRSSPALNRYLSLRLGWTGPGSRHQSVSLFAG